MIKAVIFDVFETLVTHYNCPLYFGEQIAEDIGICNERYGNQQVKEEQLVKYHWKNCLKKS